MSYISNLYDTVSTIANNKGIYNERKAKGDLEGAKAIQEETKGYYDRLRESGYEDVANHLGSIDATEANSYIKRFEPQVDVASASKDRITAADEARKDITDRWDKGYTDQYKPIDEDAIRYSFKTTGGVKADKAGRGATADNGGNIDSFSDYARNQTDMSYRAAGESAVTAARTAQQQNYNDYYSRLTDGVDKMLGRGNDALGVWSDNDISREQSYVERYLGDTTLEGQKYVADKNFEGVKETSYTDRYLGDANKEIASIEADAQKYGVSAEIYNAFVQAAGSAYQSIMAAATTAIEKGKTFNIGDYIKSATSFLQSGGTPEAFIKWATSGGSGANNTSNSETVNGQSSDGAGGGNENGNGNNSENGSTGNSGYKPVDDAVVAAVLRGDYGNGQERIDRLTAAGYDAAAVQAVVNARGGNGGYIEKVVGTEFTPTESLKSLAKNLLTKSEFDGSPKDIERFGTYEEYLKYYTKNLNEDEVNYIIQNMR